MRKESRGNESWNLKQIVSGTVQEIRRVPTRVLPGGESVGGDGVGGQGRICI